MDEKTKAQIQQEAADLVAKLQSAVPASFAPSAPRWTRCVWALAGPSRIWTSRRSLSSRRSATRTRVLPGLFELVEEVRAGVAEAGGHGARYFCTDICDGEAQGHDGINYSLPSRDMIAKHDRDPCQGHPVRRRRLCRQLR